MAGFADELKRIPMSQGLGATLARAADYAQAQAHGEVALEHLLLALTEDEDAAQVLAASHVDLSLLKSDVSLFLGGLEVRHDSGDPAKVSLAVDLKRILEAAAAAASQGRRREINGAIVLAAIVGDGRSSAAHMLRAQGLTFEEAIKALQRALAATPPPPAPVVARSDDTGHAKPDAEDILATARARVQTRAAPGLPPRAEPVPVVEAKAEPVASKDAHASTAAQVEAAPWPPEVRRSDAPDFDAIQQQIEMQRVEHEEAEQASAQADAAAYEAAPDVPDYGSAVHSEPPQYQMPPAPPVMPPVTPSSSGPRVPPQLGSRWPAPVAPAWRDQPKPPVGHEQTGFAPPPVPGGFGAPPPLPPPVAPGFAPPPKWTESEMAPPWPDQDRHQNSYENSPPPSHHGEQGYDQSRFDPSFAPVPPPVPWPDDQVMDAQTYSPDQGPERGLQPMSPAAQEGYHPAWPHQQPAPQWDDQAPQAEAFNGGGPGGLVPVPVGGPEADSAPVAARGSRRRKADRAAAGQMGEGIPRRMRAHVASSVDVGLGRAEMTSLLEGLCEGGGRDVALASLSVKLRAPEGRFVIDAVSPETQWLPDDSALPDGAFSSWRWTVTPLKSGRRRLQLAVWARTVSPDGTAVVTPLPDQTIEVRVGSNFGRAIGLFVFWVVLIGAGWLAATYGGAVYGPVMAEVMKLLK